MGGKQFSKKHKAYFDEVYDSVILTNTISALVSFFIAGFYFSFIGNQIAKDAGCGSLWDAFSGKQGVCPDLEEIAILDSGNGWAEGGVFSTILVFSSIMGLIIANTRWLYHQKKDKGELRIDPSLNQYFALEETFDKSDEETKVSLIEVSQEEEFDWVDRINKMSLNAWYLSKLAMIPAFSIGIPKMFTVGERILQQLGCNAGYTQLIFNTNAVIETCGVESVYYGMTSIAYPWTFFTWLSYGVWEAAFLYQLLVPKKIKTTIKKPFQCLWEVLQNYMPAVNGENWKDVCAITGVTLKVTGLLALYASIYSVLSDGVEFSNKFLNDNGCKNFISTLFSPNFDSDSFMCMPLLQILGIDAFPTKTEIFDFYPIFLLVVVGGGLLGLAGGFGAIKRCQDRDALMEKVKYYDDNINQVMTVGKYSALMFIPIAAYGLFAVAIPKANSMLDLKNCSNSHYPSFVYDAFIEDCSVTDRYRANATFVSTMWIFFSYPALLSAMAGMFFAGAYKSIKGICEYIESDKKANIHALFTIEEKSNDDEEELDDSKTLFSKMQIV